MKRKVFLISCGMSVLMLFTGCTRRSVENVVDEINKSIDNSIHEDDIDYHVEMVKNGTSFDYPDITYGEAFEAFFAEPRWKYFQAEASKDDQESEEIPEETGSENNGKPLDVVEFTGYCTYQDVEVEACIQFKLDMDNGTFQTGYVGFNDVPQSSYMANALVNKAFETYMEKHGMSDRITEE